MINPSNIIRHELIGLIVKSGGVEGDVVDETQKTIVVETRRGERHVFKVNHNFIFNIGKTHVEVDGKYLLGRPWERIGKKVTKW